MYKKHIRTLQSYRRGSTCHSLGFTKVLLCLFILISFSSFGCSEDHDELSARRNDRSGQTEGTHEEGPLQDDQNSSDVYDYYEPGDDQAGTEGYDDNYSDDSDFIGDSNSVRESSARESDEPVSQQAWQESEEAQRLATVDVGGGEQLNLSAQRVITRIEGHRARTIVDQIFYSPYSRALDASASPPVKQ